MVNECFLRSHNKYMFNWIKGKKKAQLFELIKIILVLKKIVCNLRDNNFFPEDYILKKVCDLKAGFFLEIGHMGPPKTSVDCKRDYIRYTKYLRL